MTNKRELYVSASQTAFKNAIKLLEEAKILQSYNHISRSYALSVLSMEEISKTLLYRCVSVGLFDEHKVRKFTLDHENKIKHSQVILAILTMLIDEYDKISHALEHDKTTEHENHILPQIVTDGIKSSLKSMTESFSNANYTKFDAIYVDVKEGKILDPNERIELDKVTGAIMIIEKSLSMIMSIINDSDEVFSQTMNDSIFKNLVKIKFE